MSIFDKKEIEVAHFFASELYEDYELCVDQNDQETDIIVYTWKVVVKLQIVSCDDEALHARARWYHHPFKIWNIWSKDRIVSIIEKIAHKSQHYAPSLIRNIILIIYSEYKHINKLSLIERVNQQSLNSNYHHIYYVVLPDNWDKTTFPPRKGSIIKLK